MLHGGRHLTRWLTAAIGVAAALVVARASAQGSATPSAEEATARLRIVNLAFAASGEASALDVHSGFRADGPILVASLAFGHASEYQSVPAGRTTALVVPAGKTGNDDVLGDQSLTLASGDAVTLLVARGDTTLEGRPAVAFKIYREISADSDSSLPTPPAGKVLVVGDVLATQHVWPGSPTFELGRAKGGCLRKLRDEDRTSPISGTFAVPYLAEPGTLELAAFGGTNSACRGAPVAPAVTVSAQPGDRLLAFIHAISPSTAALLVLPMLSAAPPPSAPTH